MSTKVIIGVVLGAVILFGAVALLRKDAPTGGSSAESASLEGKSENFVSVPDFALSDYEGQTVTPHDFPGKVLVVNSWATWCPFCVDELPAFAALAEEFSESIVVIAIDRSESRELAKSYTDDLGVTDSLVFLLDPKDSFYRSLGGFSMPETIFVDTDGNIRIHKRGPMDLAEMREKVQTLLE